MTSPILVTAGTGTLDEYLRASHRRRLIVPIWLPGRAARELRGGGNLAPEQAVGQRTWEEFLAERIGQPVG